MFSAQRAVSTVPADEQSVLPTMRGLPWWGAVLLATGLTTIGAVIDASSNNGLGAAFKFCYLVGCLAAALTVRRRALFTAGAQPPLIAFAVGIISLYTVHASQASASLKSMIFAVMLPIAEIFPWLAVTFLATLGIVVGRWYITRDHATPIRLTGKNRATDRTDADTSTPNRTNPIKKSPSKSNHSRSKSARSATNKSTAPSDRERTPTRRSGGDAPATRTAQRVTSRTQAQPRSTAGQIYRDETGHPIKESAEPSKVPGARQREGL